jgi:hypothetical protein
VVIQGKQEDIDVSLQKVHAFLKWKHFQSIGTITHTHLINFSGKLQSQLRIDCKSEETSLQGPQYRNQIDVPSHVDSSLTNQDLLEKEKVHSLLAESAYAEAKRNCKQFYNQGLGPNRIDLHGLRQEDALQLLKTRIEQIEAMPVPPFEQV